MSDEELPSPRAKHYRGEFKRRKETSELIEWILDEFEQTEQRYEHALRKLKRAIRNEAAYHHLMDACQQTLTSPLPLNTLASALASALRWSIRMSHGENPELEKRIEQTLNQL